MFRVVSCSEEEGIGFVETSNLDGESNLKIRQAPANTRMLSLDNIVSSHCVCDWSSELTHPCCAVCSPSVLAGVWSVRDPTTVSTSSRGTFTCKTPPLPPSPPSHHLEHPLSMGPLFL